jgi:dTDP-L-rhamnose 4-epimerase
MILRDKIAVVTGGLGFIGTNLMKKIIAKYKLIIIVDNLSPRVHGANNRNIHPDPSTILIEGDVQDRLTWKRVEAEFPKNLFKLDVIHLASDTSTADSILNPTAHVETNVLGTAIMLEFLQNHLESLNLVLVTSTRAVYGEGLWLNPKGNLVNPGLRLKQNLEIGKWNPYFEELECTLPYGTSFKSCPPNPSNIYGSTKLAQENLIRIWSETNGVRYSILRLQNVYGPEQSLWNSYSGVVSLFIKQALLSKRIEVYEGGGIIRDFIFVDDVVRIINHALDDPNSFRMVDVGTGVPISLLDLAILISMKTSRIKPIVTNKYRLGDVRGIYSNNLDLITNLPGFTFTELENGIELLIKWAESRIGIL